MTESSSTTIIPETVSADSARDHSALVETLEECPLCSGTSWRRLPTPGHWIGGRFFSCGAGTFTLRRCKTCSLSFVNPRPGPALLDAFYDCNEYECHSPGAGNEKAAQFLFGYLDRYGPYDRKRFLDFGCGGGFLLREAVRKNWNAVGYDVGQRALASCREQGLQATDNLDDLSSSDVDVIFLNHVFEHLSEPWKVLSQCKRLLSRDGKVFIVVPNLGGLRARLSFPFLSQHFPVDERYRAFPIHLFYFTPATLSALLERNGFCVTGMETFGLGLYEFVNRTGTNGMVAGNANVARRENHVLREKAKKVFFNSGLGENLLVVASPA